MIPKIVHYCWFGRGEMPELATKCLNSWKKYLPNYELKLWNEDNFDVNINTYTKEAYEVKKYAFVTDYVRLFVLEKYGGVYMDTDVEVIKPLDRFLDLPAFSGFESDKYAPTGIMASEKNGKWVKEQIEYYRNRNFILPNGEPDLKSNTLIISESMTSNGFLLNNRFQIYQDCIHIFPKDYFSPKQYGKIFLTENTHCIHHFSGSWKTKSLWNYKFLLPKLFGDNFMYLLIIAKKKYKGIMSAILNTQHSKH